MSTLTFSCFLLASLPRNENRGALVLSFCLLVSSFGMLPKFLPRASGSLPSFNRLGAMRQKLFSRSVPGSGSLSSLSFLFRSRVLEFVLLFSWVVFVVSNKVATLRILALYLSANVDLRVAWRMKTRNSRNSYFFVFAITFLDRIVFF